MNPAPGSAAETRPATPDTRGSPVNDERKNFAPLADRMRPRALDTFWGQQHLVGAGKPLRRALESGRLHSMVFWGPPGSGKFSTFLALHRAGL